VLVQQHTSDIVAVGADVNERSLSPSPILN
jgi:hypothetical protein